MLKLVNCISALKQSTELSLTPSHGVSDYLWHTPLRAILTSRRGNSPTPINREMSKANIWVLGYSYLKQNHTLVGLEQWPRCLIVLAWSKQAKRLPFLHMAATLADFGGGYFAQYDCIHMCFWTKMFSTVLLTSRVNPLTHSQLQLPLKNELYRKWLKQCPSSLGLSQSLRGAHTNDMSSTFGFQVLSFTIVFHNKRKYGNSKDILHFTILVTSNRNHKVQG